MPKTRDPNLPQHHMTQGHYGEFDLQFLPDGVDVGDVIQWDGADWIITQITADGRVKVSATDTTADYAGTKIVAGDNITITILNPGGNEQIEISATGGGSAGEVLMADGVSNPPEPLTNEDGDDWLYEG